MAYLARFSYDVRPADRRRALDFIRREVTAARREGRAGRVASVAPGAPRTCRAERNGGIGGFAAAARRCGPG